MHPINPYRTSWFTRLHVQLLVLAYRMGFLVVEEAECLNWRKWTWSPLAEHERRQTKRWWAGVRYGRRHWWGKVWKIKAKVYRSAAKNWRAFAESNSHMLELVTAERAWAFKEVDRLNLELAEQLGHTPPREAYEHD